MRAATITATPPIRAAKTVAQPWSSFFGRDILWRFSIAQESDGTGETVKRGRRKLQGPGQFCTCFVLIWVYSPKYDYSP
jgi:hypothetical protein